MQHVSEEEEREAFDDRPEDPNPFPSPPLPPELQDVPISGAGVYRSPRPPWILSPSVPPHSFHFSLNQSPWFSIQSAFHSFPRAGHTTAFSHVSLACTEYVPNPSFSEWRDKFRFLVTLRYAGSSFQRALGFLFLKIAFLAYRFDISHPDTILVCGGLEFRRFALSLFIRIPGPLLKHSTHTGLVRTPHGALTGSIY